MSNDETYDVGYKRPPLDSRFTKGKSGNPRGRPKKKIQSADDFLNRELDRKINVTVGTRTKRISKRDAILMTVVQRALKGDLPAIKLVAKRCFERPLEESQQEILVARMGKARKTLNVKLADLARRAQEREHSADE
jgi:Family of unknown function (DUF5681)